MTDEDRWGRLRETLERLHAWPGPYTFKFVVPRARVSDVREAGVHRAMWDGRDATGQKVSAGVYFYRLTAEGKSLTKKMTMMK